MQRPEHPGYLGLALLAFFFAVGLSAHALDELAGRPMKTGFSDTALWVIAVTGLLTSAGFAIAGAVLVTWWIVPLFVVGGALMVGYNLELWGGLVHTDAGFALSWGAFPVAVGAVSQAQPLHPSHLVVALAAYWLARAQRVLSLRARSLRRQAATIEGTIVHLDGTSTTIDRTFLLEPAEQALRWMTWCTVALAAGLFIGRVA